jgi:DNA-binding transcriptional ArsR family regulator
MKNGAIQTRYHIAEIGALLSDPGRAAILLALMDGTIRPAGELARMAGVAPSTASAHLKKLTDSELLSAVHQGRNRYYRLADDRVAQLIEDLSVAGVGARPANPWRGDPVMLRARTCYNHLAGALGVALFEKIRAGDGWTLSGDAVLLSDAGSRRLKEVGILDHGEGVGDVPGRTCVDWTERRFHLGGRLGAWLASRLFQREWLRRRASTRALTATSAGRRGLSALGLEWDSLAG